MSALTFPYSVRAEFWKQLPNGAGCTDSVYRRAVGRIGSSPALEEFESFPTRDSIVKHFLCWNIVVLLVLKIGGSRSKQIPQVRFQEAQTRFFFFFLNPLSNLHTMFSESLFAIHNFHVRDIPLGSECATAVCVRNRDAAAPCLL